MPPGVASSDRMRTPFAAVAAALLVAAMACGASGASGSKPRLRLAHSSLRGSNFAPRELVRLSFSGPAPRAQRRVRVRVSGKFTTALPAAKDPCIGPLVVSARGATGDFARLKLPQRACPPAAQPGP
jgi:hypothetical protein